ncbi:MAG: TPM domain-containing protein [Bacteroidia bacterium]|nr:TPM domain-containing protein [Bacteroidia bacterium]
MKTLIYFFSGLIVFLLFSCGPNNFPKSGTVEQTKENYKFPESKGAVNDLENILSENEELQLNGLIDSFRNNIKSDVLLLTTDTIYYFDDIKNYMHVASKQWGRGHAINPYGITIAVSKKLYQARISTGDSIFAVIPDSLIGNILDEKMVPDFKKNYFFSGIKAGLRELGNELKKD